MNDKGYPEHWKMDESTISELRKEALRCTPASRMVILFLCDQLEPLRQQLQATTERAERAEKALNEIAECMELVCVKGPEDIVEATKEREDDVNGAFTRAELYEESFLSICNVIGVEADNLAQTINNVENKIVEMVDTLKSVADACYRYQCPKAICHDRVHKALSQSLDMERAPAKDNLSPEVLLFAQAMQYKIDKNAHKDNGWPTFDGNGVRSWKDCKIDFLYKKLEEEHTELVGAVEAGEPLENILHEAADVANIAMFIADNRGSLKGLSANEYKGGE